MEYMMNGMQTSRIDFPLCFGHKGRKINHLLIPYLLFMPHTLTHHPHKPIISVNPVIFVRLATFLNLLKPIVPDNLTRFLERRS